MKISSIIIATLFVGAAGIIARTLFTNDKGLKTRSKAQGYKDSFVNNFNDFADSVSHPFEKLEDETVRLRKKANAKVKEIKAEVNQKLN